jgi:hypothetical protein
LAGGGKWKQKLQNPLTSLERVANGVHESGGQWRRTRLTKAVCAAAATCICRLGGHGAVGGMVVVNRLRSVNNVVETQVETRSTEPAHTRPGPPGIACGRATVWFLAPGDCQPRRALPDPHSRPESPRMRNISLGIRPRTLSSVRRGLPAIST